MKSEAVDARVLEGRVWSALEQGQPQQALANCRELNERYPDWPDGWHTASRLAERLGNFPAALQAIEKALTITPTRADWQLQRVAALMHLGRVEAAEQALAPLDSHQWESAYSHSRMGLILSRLDRHAEALTHYLRAADLEPRDSQHLYNIATLHRFLGDSTSAETALNRAIALNPRDGAAYKLRADLRRWTAEQNHIDQLQARFATDEPDPRNRLQVGFALAKELEDVGHWRDSFTALSTAATMRRALMRYDVAGDLQTMHAIQETYGGDSVRAEGDPGLNQPIFIFGMPRTGSTLLEQVLSGHSSVHAAGELNDFALSLSALSRPLLPTGQGANKLDLVAASARLDFARLGQEYARRTHRASAGAPHFIDKMPLNFLYAGLIHRALPGARMIHVRRNPLDTCYAVYKALFADAYPFSYDLVELGRYYAAYSRLMEHWRQVLPPGTLLEVDYEALVDDLEGQARRLLAECELNWEPQCLDFHARDTASTTASASQVREPLYRRSLGKWRHFGEELKPLIRTLEEEGVDLSSSY